MSPNSNARVTLVLMPKHLLIAFALYIAARAAMAVLAPFHETGIARVTSPLLMLIFIAAAVLFMRRVAWAWQIMQMIVVAEIGINAAFFPIAEFYGPFTGLARSIIGALMLACFVIIWSIRCSPQTKAWFSNLSA